VVQGEKWREFRSKVQQDMMRPKSALFYIDDLTSIVDEVIEKLENNMNNTREISDLNTTLNQFGLEAIGVMFIGARLGVLQGTEEGSLMLKTAERFFQLFQTFAMFPPNFAKYVPQYWEFVECQRVFIKICSKHIAEAREKDKLDGSLEGTILGKMIKSCGEDSDIPTVMAVDALTAGIDTTGNSATILLYHLATNPDKQESLYQEILKHVGKDGNMTEQTLAEMRYLKACLQESQRIAPVAQATARMTQVDMVLGGYQIPSGTAVLRHGTIASTHEDNFSQPDQFLPERWIRGCGHFEKKNPYANLPFGQGPRSCIGQRFARLELYMIAFRMVQKFRLEYDGPPLEMIHSGLGRLDGDVKLRMIRR